jgi:hypothetical protein
VVTSDSRPETQSPDGSRTSATRSTSPCRKALGSDNREGAWFRSARGSGLPPKLRTGRYSPTARRPGVFGRVDPPSRKPQVPHHLLWNRNVCRAYPNGDRLKGANTLVKGWRFRVGGYFKPWSDFFSKSRASLSRFTISSLRFLRFHKIRRYPRVASRAMQIGTKVAACNGPSITQSPGPAPQSLRPAPRLRRAIYRRRRAVAKPEIAS